MAIVTEEPDSLGLGNNAGELITRGLAEAKRLGVALGGRPSRSPPDPAWAT